MRRIFNKVSRGGLAVAAAAIVAGAGVGVAVAASNNGAPAEETFSVASLTTADCPGAQDTSLPTPPAASGAAGGSSGGGMTITVTVPVIPAIQVMRQQISAELTCNGLTEPVMTEVKPYQLTGSFTAKKDGISYAFAVSCKKNDEAATVPNPYNPNISCAVTSLNKLG